MIWTIHDKNTNAFFTKWIFLTCQKTHQTKTISNSVKNFVVRNDEKVARRINATPGRNNASSLYFTGSEAPWQNGLVERNGGIWKASARKAIKDGRGSRLRGNTKTRLHGELGKECPHHLVWILACPLGHWSRIQVAMVASG